MEGLFDTNWHKLHLSVMNDRVSVYIDCKLKSTVAIQPRGVIDPRGEVTIGRTLRDNAPVVVSMIGKTTILCYCESLVKRYANFFFPLTFI